MTKQTEAMKLALEALEEPHPGIRTSFTDAVTYREKVKQAITALREALAEQPAQQEPDLSMREPSAIRDRLIQAGWTPPSQQQEPVRVPVTDNTYNYAKSLAEAIFKQHFASDEHYASGRIVWGVNDTVIGILTQIDNMVADMVRRPAQQEPVDKKGSPCPEFWDWLPKAYNFEGVGNFTKYNMEVAFLAGMQTTSPPAQRTWVGLTDEERDELLDIYITAEVRARAIEAKLKEKNA